ncbi:MAG TPA: glycosyltransferase family 4 protein [Anaerolineales bacterium]|nr:glycosyltransferase family 4 protein [Anaerolineales bacterium]
MRLLFITQKVDRADWLLGFTHGWLKTLAARVDKLIVICLEQGETDLPPNVRVISLGRERGVNRLGRAINFVRALAATIGEADGVFAHMSPLFAIAAAPFAKARRLPLVLWYTHRSVNAALRLATVLCDAVVTASPESFQLPTNKLRVLGHGIDSTQFAPREQEETREPPLILAVGRLSPIKRYELLIEAARRLRLHGIEFRCAIAGDDPPGSRDYGDSLRALGRGHVEFLGPVPHAEIAAWYHRCSVGVNLCPTGGLDKAVLEAMFCARPVVVTNQAFAPLLGAEGAGWLAAEDAEAVAIALVGVLSDPDSGRKADVIRARAIATHSLGGLMDRLVQVFKEKVESYV